MSVFKVFTGRKEKAMLYVSDDFGKTWTPVKEGSWMELDSVKTQLEKAGYAVKYLRGDEVPA